MIKKLLIVVMGIILVGVACIWLSTKSNEIGTPVRVENIINADFIRNGDVICRLFFYEDEGEYFIEQTGNGVYTFSKEAYDLIDNYICMEESLCLIRKQKKISNVI